MNNTSTSTTTMIGHSTPTVGWDPSSLPKISATASSGTLNVIGVSNTKSNLVLTSSATGTSAWSTIAVNNDMTEFCELVLAVLGHDIKYQDFQKMSKEERKSLLRDIKIKRVLD